MYWGVHSAASSPLIITIACSSSWLMFMLLRDPLLYRGPLTIADYTMFVSFILPVVPGEKGICSTSHIHSRRKGSPFEHTVLSLHFPLLPSLVLCGQLQTHLSVSSRVPNQREGLMSGLASMEMWLVTRVTRNACSFSVVTRQAINAHS